MNQKSVFKLTLVWVILMVPYCSAWWNPITWLDGNAPIPDNEPTYKWNGVAGDFLLDLDLPFEITHDDGIQDENLFWPHNETDFVLLDVCLYQVTKRLFEYCRPGVVPDVTVEHLALQELYCRTVAAGRDGNFCFYWGFLNHCVNKEMDAKTRMRYMVVSNKLHVQCWTKRTVEETRRVLNELLTHGEQNYQAISELEEVTRHQVEKDEKYLALGQEEATRVHSTLLKLKKVSDKIRRSIIRKIREQDGMLGDEAKDIKKMIESVKQFVTEVSNDLGVLDIRRQLHDDVIVHSNVELAADSVDMATALKGVELDISNKYDELARYEGELKTLISETMECFKETEHAMELAMRLLHMVDYVIDFVEEYYHMLQSHDEKTLRDVAIHVAYFALSLLIILYLDTPLMSRIVVSVVIPLNGVCRVGVESSLSYESLGILITVVITGDLGLREIFRRLHQKEVRAAENTLKVRQIRRSQDKYQISEWVHGNGARVFRKEPVWNGPYSYVPHSYTQIPPQLVGPAYGYQFHPYNTFTSSHVCQSPSRWTRQCVAITQSGNRCKNNRRPQSECCALHCGYNYTHAQSGYRY